MIDQDQPLDVDQRFDDVLRILDADQFTKRDVLDVTGLTDARLKNTLDRKVGPKPDDRPLVRLRSSHNPGTGRRRMFCGADILKIFVAHLMSDIGFPMRWIYLTADEVERRATGILLGSIEPAGLIIISYPQSDGDWARVPVTELSAETRRTLPVAYQVLEIDRLVIEMLEKLRALVAEEPIPDFSIPDIKPEPSPYSPENDFFLMWEKDAAGRDIRTGLTFEETEELLRYEGSFVGGNHVDDKGRYLQLHGKHEQARHKRIGDRLSKKLA